MASLTEASIVTRKIIRYAIFGLIALIIARFVFKVGASTYQRFFPPKPEKPTLAFGDLPKLPFPEKSFPDNLNFILETASGKLPVFSDKATIYFMPSIQTNIQALEAAKTKAKKLGFDPNGKPIIESIPNVYLFSKKNSYSTLTMNIITAVFSISYDINSDPSVLESRPLVPDSALSYVHNYLSKAGLLVDDLKDAPTTHQLFRVEGGKFISAISLSEANLIRVNLFRKKLGKDGNVPSVTSDMPESNVWFLLSGKGGKEIIAAEYHYFPIDFQKTATYPIKTSETAWEELKSKKAYIANIGNNEGGNIIIRKVYLAYYDAGQYMKYYQPVVVFEGDNDFYGFVPAVTDEYYGK